MSEKSDLVFQVTGLSKRFGQTLANKDINFSLRRGKIRGLAGENGSGRSTFLSQLAGIYPRDSVVILKDGVPYEPVSPMYAIEHGVSIVVQELGLIGALPAGINAFWDGRRRSHLEEMLDITDSTSILRDGELIETVNSSDIVVEDLKSKMVGRKLNGEYYRNDTKESHVKDVILSVNNLYTGSGLKDVSFQIHKGEILALCGLSDSGIHDMGKAVYGLSKITKGTVCLIPDRTVIRNQSQAWKHRVGYVPKDRDNEALMLNASIKDNFVMSSVPELSGKLMNLQWRSIDNLAENAKQRFQVKCTCLSQAGRPLCRHRRQ